MFPADPLSSERSISLKRNTFVALGLTLFVISYNLAVMPPIMPLIVRGLDSSMGYIQGAIVLFSLVTASCSPTCENLCRYYGRERVFLIGIVFYVLGIAATAISQNIGILVINFSFLTGLAATPLVSAPWAIMDFAYDGKAEKRATLALILFATFGSITGAILGGFIASRLGWRWVFVPSLLVLPWIAIQSKKLPVLNLPRQESIDWIGGLLSLLGLGSILLGISLSGEYGWWTPKQPFSILGMVIPPFSVSIVPTLIAAGAVFLGLFIFWQRQQSKQMGVPLVRVGLLRKRAFVIGVITAMLHTLVTTGIQFNLYQFLPATLPLNPFETAIAVLPYNLTMVVAVVCLILFIRFDDQIPPKYNVYMGLSLLTVGIWLLYRAITPEISTLSLIPGLVTMGIGSGFFLAYIGALTYSAAARHEKPEGTGIYNPIKQLGSSLGRGILGTTLVFFTSQGIVNRVLAALGKQFSPAEHQQAISKLQRIIQTYSREERRAAFRQLPDSVQPALKDIIEMAAIEGMRTSILLGLSLSIVCFLVATLLPKYAHRSRS
ncbi:MAG: MFS transporter [Microcoleaceae cyanobacterium]